MKWLKHHTNSTDSESLEMIIDTLGFEGYGRYWRILEILGRRFDGCDTSFRISKRELRETIRVKSAKHLGRFMDTLGKCRGHTVEELENHYEIKADILLELKSRDFKTARTERETTAPKNKIKNKEKEEEKEKEKPRAPVVEFKNPKIQVTPDEVVDLWNRTLGIKLNKPCKGLGASQRRENTINMLGHLPTLTHWGDYFDEISKSRFLTHDMRAFSFDWVVKHDNYLNVIEGKYADKVKREETHEEWAERVRREMA